MTMPTCPECGAEIGPWEGPTCVRHTKARWRSITDHASIVLENETGPIYLHDIQRGIARESGTRPDWASVSAVVGSDRRFCWSGKGLYGLFRHGRIPWVRTLADTAAFILLAADEPLSVDEIGFLMKLSGYRFQDFSLEAALRREGIFAFGWASGASTSSAGWKVTLADRDSSRARFDVLARPLPSDPQEALLAAIFGEPADRQESAPVWPVDDLLARWRAHAQSGLAERARRLASEGQADPRP